MISSLSTAGYRYSLLPRVYGVERRVIARARARHKVQPSTGGSEAGSTPTYNCGPATSPLAGAEQAGGVVPSPNQRGGGWRLRRWRDAWACGTRGDRVREGRGERQRAGATRGGGRKGGPRRGSCRPAARAHLHTTACVVPCVRHPSHSCGLLACLSALPARSRTPRGACPLPAPPRSRVVHGGTARTILSSLLSPPLPYILLSPSPPPRASR